MLERLKKQTREYNNATIILIIIMITNLLRTVGLHVLTCTIKFLHGKTGNFRWKSKGSHHSISNISENMGCDSRRCSSLSRHHLGTVYFVLSPSLTTFNFIILFMQKISIRMTCVNSISAPCTTPSIPQKLINCWR